MIDRYYCYSCRRRLSASRFDLDAYDGLDHQFCLDCEVAIMTAAQERQILEGESAIALLLWKREGGEREVMLPFGRVDLVTDEYVIEVKHVSKWLEATKVLAYTAYIPNRKPRVHLFGMHFKNTRDQILEVLGQLGIAVTFENETFEAMHPSE